MDECMKYLLEAESYIDQMVDLSMSDLFYESNQEAIRQNEKSSSGAIGALKKAVNALIQMGKNMITAIGDFFKKLIMSKEERDRFNHFKQEVRKNPEFAKKMVTVQDFKEAEAEYNKALKMIDDMIASGKEMSKESMKVFESDIEKTINLASSLSKRASVSIPMRLALKIADTNAASAKMIQKALENEIISLEEIENTLGYEKAAMFERKINHYARDTRLHRLKLRVLGRKNKTLQEIMGKNIKDLASFFDTTKNIPSVTTDSLVRGVKKNPRIALDIADKQSIGDAVSVGLNIRKAGRQKREFEKFLGINKKKKKK